MGYADLGFREFFMNHFVNLSLRLHQIFKSLVAYRKTFNTRRFYALNIAQSNICSRLINRNPKLHINKSFRSDKFVYIACKISNSFFICPTALFGDPNRQSPMPERYEWFQLTLPERRDYLTVMFDFLFVPSPFFWFHARPFDGKTVYIVVQRLRDIKILAEAVIVVAGQITNIVLRIKRR